MKSQGPNFLHLKIIIILIYILYIYNYNIITWAFSVKM